jgi:chorismate mutase
MADDPLLIREAITELLEAVLDDNDLVPNDLISAVFTTTPDLVSEFPAHAARLYGWNDIPMICAQELPVPGALPRCVRVMVHCETRRSRSEIRHVYLRDAVLLRGRIEEVSYPGGIWRHAVRVGDRLFMVDDAERHSPGSPVRVRLPAETLFVFASQGNGRTAGVRAGQQGREAS